MGKSPGSRSLPGGVEIALAFASGLVSFTVVAVTLAAADSDVVAVLLGVVAVAAVLAIARRFGPAYAIPVAISSLVGFDWFQFPPTHPEEIPDTDNMLTLFSYLAVGTFGGEIAAYALRRGAVSEAARTELAGEQEALRRVATLVAGGARQSDVFAAIARELAALFSCDRFWMLRYEEDGTASVVATSDTDGPLPVGSRHLLGGVNLATRVAQAGQPTRIDDVSIFSGSIGAKVRSTDLRSVVGAPICINLRTWGVMVAGTTGDEPLPPGSEFRLSEFTKLMASAIENTESRAEAARLAEQQAALRRVATLVAKDAPPADVFAKVAEEAAHVFGELHCTIVRAENPSTAKVVAVSGDAGPTGFPVGTLIELEGDGAIQSVLREGTPQRVDDYSQGSAVIAEGARERGVTSAVGCPIAVGSRTWGAIVVATFGAQAPASPDTEAELAQFAELVATAIANTEARAEVARLAEQQTGLRRVATLVAEGVEPAALFDAVTKEVERLFNSGGRSLVPSIIRFDAGGEFVLVGTSKPQFKLPLGSRWKAKDLYVSTRVLQTRTSARVEAADLEFVGGPDAELLRQQGFLHQVGSPIVVEGRLWGAMTINSTDELPPDTGRRLESFTELVATAIANSEARAEVEQLAEEQAALRRVATLVAEGATPSVVFDAVTAEMESVLDADGMLLSRYESGDAVTVLAHRGPKASLVPVGTRLRHEPESATAKVRQTGAPARIDSYAESRGDMGGVARLLEVGTAVGTPIVVDGRLWGIVTATWRGEQAPPADTEERMAKFAQLLDTAIANADSRDQLTASRVRLLTAADEARRRVVRDLHDGAQQRLVHSIITLKLAQRALHGDGEAAALVNEALEQAEQGNAELRELAHGILPSVLTRGGLRAGVDTVVARLDLPVAVDITDARFPAEIEASAYFIVAEALTNVVKHARATGADVTAYVATGCLHIEVRDYGIGGADAGGHGLVGLRDRAAALGGRLEVESPAGGGTRVLATLPLEQPVSP